MPQLILRGKSVGMVEGILFDKDGTLIKSESRLLQLAKFRLKESARIYKEKQVSSSTLKELNSMLSLNYGIHKNKINPNSSLAIASRKDNLISTATVFSILGETWPDSLKLSHEIFKSVDQLLKNQTTVPGKDELLPGVKSLLQDLSKTNLKVGIISNDSNIGIKNFLEKYQFEKYFQDIWSSEDFPAKPDPNAVRKLCAQMKVKTSACAFIGDSETDLLMARKSNIKIVCGYLSGWSIKPSLYEYDHLIQDWNELSIQ